MSEMSNSVIRIRDWQKKIENEKRFKNSLRVCLCKIDAAIDALSGLEYDSFKEKLINDIDRLRVNIVTEINKGRWDT